MSCLHTFATLDHTSEYYINDYAQVLTPETKEYILNNSNALCEKTKAQIVVVTINSLEGRDISEYSLELFRSWGIGDKKLNNGLLILLSIEDREIKIDVGDGLEGRINDSKAGRFLDEYSGPYFKSNDWDTGIKTLYSALLEEVYSEYDLEMPAEVSEVVSNCKNVSEDSKMSVLMGVVIVALILVFGGILPLIRKRKRFGDFYEDTSSFGGIDFWDGFGSGDNDNFGGFSGGGGASRKF